MINDTCFNKLQLKRKTLKMNDKADGNGLWIEAKADYGLLSGLMTEPLLRNNLPMLKHVFGSYKHDRWLGKCFFNFALKFCCVIYDLEKDKWHSLMNIPRANVDLHSSRWRFFRPLQITTQQQWQMEKYICVHEVT